MAQHDATAADRVRMYPATRLAGAMQIKYTDGREYKGALRSSVEKSGIDTKHTAL